MSLPKIILKPGRDHSLLRSHLWVFSGAIAETEGAPEDGEVVDVFSAEKKFLARGHFSKDRSIAVRILSFEQEEIDQGFFEKRIASAWGLRATLGLAASKETSAFRLVNAEGDLLPGLIIDLYGQTAVIDCQSLGMSKIAELVASALQSVLHNRLSSVYLKNGDSSRYLLGEQSTDIITEHGLCFKVDWQSGQKTGFFLDQRENRALLKKFCAGKKVLNTFCYTGAFSVYALAGGATSVDSVDSSTQALALLNANLELNFAGKPIEHKAYELDCFDFLGQSTGGYEVIVLDPPAFAKHANAVEPALKGYTQLNLAALKVLEPGGILFTFSCSQLVDSNSFGRAVQLAAQKSHRQIRVLHLLDQAPCHPVNIFHPEGRYLKGLVLEVQ